MVDSLKSRLVSLLQPEDLQLLRDVARAAEALDMPLYAVGGLPRDLLLGKVSHDVDLVVEGDAIRLAQTLVSGHGGSVTTHRQFGTATWRRDQATRRPKETVDRMPRPIGVDVVTARAETYLRPAQLPKVRAGTIWDDLRRRDFTINAIAIRLDGKHFGRVLDPMGGIEDLQNKHVRVLHDLSFEDDPTRLYRAVRYEQRLGLRLSRNTVALIPTGARWVRAVSGQRLRSELELILREPRGADMLKRLSQLGLLRRIHPALPADAGCLRRLRRQSPLKRSGWDTEAEGSAEAGTWIPWLLDLTAAKLRAVGRRLVFGRVDMELILQAANLYQTAAIWGAWRPSRIVFRLDTMPESVIVAVHAALPAGNARLALQAYHSSWRHIRPQTTGRVLKERGLRPGPHYRMILQSLRAAWIDGEVADAQGERLMLERLIRRASSRTSTT